jgi:hypothetical protein
MNHGSLLIRLTSRNLMARIVTGRVTGRCPTLSYSKYGLRSPDMTGCAQTAALVYGIGVLWGILAIEARPAARVGLALVWPLGPVAFVVTVAVLLASAPLAFIGRR